MPPASISPEDIQDFLFGRSDLATLFLLAGNLTRDYPIAFRSV
jgi:hypothetical protein